MTTELDSIEGAVYAECPECDMRLLADPTDGKPALVIGHNADGSHSYTPTGGPDADDGSQTHEENEA